MDIFKEQKFYPDEETPIKEHYSGCFDSVFLSFIPFFRMDETKLDKPSFQRVHQITYPQFKSANPDLNLPENLSADIYTNDNPDYPTGDDIRKFGAPVKWSEVAAGVGFESLAEVDKALGTTIGHYRAVFAREDLADRLLRYAEGSQTFLPQEGTYDVFAKRGMLKSFRFLGINKVVVRDEFLEKNTTLDISGLTDEEFSSNLQHKDYYIHDIDRQLLFAIDWDDFFFLIAAPTEVMQRVLAAAPFEGFFCDASTKVTWETTDAELEAGWAKEREQQDSDS